MKPAPNWRCTTDPVDGVWKQDLLRWIGKELNLRYLIETGTCEGSTPAAVYKDFERIHTIELSEHFFNHAVNRLAHTRNVSFYLGDSVSLLPQIIKRIPIEEKVLVWLDAHPCGGFSANNGDPLPGELKIIDELLGPDRAVVVIDDMNNADLNQVAAAGVHLDRWLREYRTGEVILYGPNLMVPPFEG